MANDASVLSTASPVLEDLFITDENKTMYFRHDLTAGLWQYGWPPLCMMGLVGNTLVLLVLRRDGLVRTSANVYLSALVVGDSLELMVASLAAYPVYAWRLCLEDTTMWTRNCIWAVHHALGNVSIWLIVAFTVERCVVVRFPLLKLRLCTPRNAGLCCGSLLVLAFVENIDLFFLDALSTNATSGDVTCFVPLHYLDDVNVTRPGFNLVSVTVVPVCVILFCNWAIISGLRRKLLPTVVRHPATRPTVMCLGVSFTFVVCVVPYHVIAVFGRYWPMTQPTRAAVVHSCLLLRYTNHAVNFFLYSLTGAHFRSELVALFRSSTQRGDRLRPNMCVG